MFSVDGLIFIYNRLLIPSDLRADILNQLHKGHVGKNIEDTIKRSTTCQKFQRKDPKKRLISQNIPNKT